MPFAPQTVPIQPTLNAVMSENARVFAVGVSRYDDLRFAPIPSATQSVMSWLIVALRLGISPHGNPVLVEEVGGAGALHRRMNETLSAAELSDAERAQLGGMLADIRATDSAAETRLLRPTYQNLTESLMLLGNHLACFQSCRMLFTFSGHGAVVQGRLALCPSDAAVATAPPSPSALSARARTLVSQLRAEADLHPVAELLERLAVEAEAKGALMELLDLVSRTLRSRSYGAEVRLALLQQVEQNLSLLSPQTGLPAPTLSRVITPVHLILALGQNAERVTMILDTCHAGGPSSGLQGSLARHTWIDAGLRCRVVSASQDAQLAAEARIGDRRIGAATWALTQVLSRWSRVEDGEGYALGIRHGDLVLRANLLLTALSFRQQLSLHAPPALSGPSVADFAFFGLSATTQTTSDPSAGSGGLQISSDNPGVAPSLTIWRISQGGTLRAALLAVGTDAPAWTFTVSGVQRTYAPNTLTVFSTPGDVTLLDGQPFQMTMASWDGVGQAPAPFTGPVTTFGNTPLFAPMPAKNDSLERAYVMPPSQPRGFMRYQRPGGGREVFLRWLAPIGAGPGALQIVSKVGFPFTPNDFDAQGEMSFAACPNPNFTASCVERLINQ
jgi:hypothetical protein